MFSMFPFGNVFVAFCFLPVVFLPPGAGVPGGHAAGLVRDGQYGFVSFPVLVFSNHLFCLIFRSFFRLFVY